MSHRFHCLDVSPGGGSVLDILLDAGPHGDVIEYPPGPLPAEDAGDGETLLGQCIVRNAGELARAREELRKWTERVRLSPLGIVQQDYRAYYEEIVSRFVRWFERKRLPLPPDNS